MLQRTLLQRWLEKPPCHSCGSWVGSGSSHSPAAISKRQRTLRRVPLVTSALLNVRTCQTAQHQHHHKRRAAGANAAQECSMRQQHICRSSAAGVAIGAPEPARRPQLPNLGTGQQMMKQLKRMAAAFPIGWVIMFSYLIFMLLIPIAALLYKAYQVPLMTFIARATEPVAVHAYYVTLTMGGVACIVNAVFGLLLAWVLVKYDFPGKKWIDAAVDVPFALPTSVAGLTLSTVYNEDGLLGQFLTKMGVDVVFNQTGVCLAMIFVSFPFVVRTMQPVLLEMEREAEEAAWTLGASPIRTFIEVLLPPLLPALLTGSALAFSRAIGEFGSIVIISSNFPFKDLIAPILIFQCLEQYDFVGATVIGTVLLAISLGMMLVVNWLQTFKQSAPR